MGYTVRLKALYKIFTELDIESEKYESLGEKADIVNLSAAAMGVGARNSNMN